MRFRVVALFHTAVIAAGILAAGSTNSGAQTAAAPNASPGASVHTRGTNNAASTNVRTASPSWTNHAVQKSRAPSFAE